MNAEPFVDTNIWVYAHLEQPGLAKGVLARSLVTAETRFVITTQVLNEYHVAMARNRVALADIRANVELMIHHCDVRLLTLPVIRHAHDLRAAHGFSYWDCLIVASALQAGCTILYSEYLQHRQLITESLRIVNPFVEPPS